MAIDGWFFLGLGAQICFFMRFLIQWIVSERRKQCVVPVHFWYFSMAGGLGLLIYAIHIRDPIFILGQSTGVFIYLRNLMLMKKNAASDS